jgi:DNA-binding MarR family transcriptional regulator
MASSASVAESVSIWFRLLSCHARILSGLRRELEETVTIARFDLLASLHRRNGQTPAALSRDLLVTAGNVTGLVDRAERDGVVVRKPDPSDRRVVRVWLTEGGRKLIAGLLPSHAAFVHGLFEGLPAARRRELRRNLGELRAHLGVSRAPGPVASRASGLPNSSRASARSR